MSAMFSGSLRFRKEDDGKKCRHPPITASEAPKRHLAEARIHWASVHGIYEQSWKAHGIPKKPQTRDLIYCEAINQIESYKLYTR